MALIKAAASGDVSAVSRLIREGVEPLDGRNSFFSWTAVMWATNMGHVSCIKALLAAKADPDASGCAKKRTALMLAASSARAAERSVKLLLAAKANVSAQDDSGTTALMAASSQGRAECVKMLLAAGAVHCMDFENRSGWTALMHAAHYGHAGCLRLLVAARATVWILSSASDGRRSALDLARQQGHADIVRALMHSGSPTEKMRRRMSKSLSRRNSAPSCGPANVAGPDNKGAAKPRSASADDRPRAVRRSSSYSPSLRFKGGASAGSERTSASEVSVQLSEPSGGSKVIHSDFAQFVDDSLERRVVSSLHLGGEPELASSGSPASPPRYEGLAAESEVDVGELIVTVDHEAPGLSRRASV